MEPRSFFTKHYEFITDLGCIIMVAIVIFPMALSVVFKICALVVAALLFGWLVHPADQSAPLCGRDINAEAVTRPWQRTD
jgi:hypothetical protein